MQGVDLLQSPCVPGRQSLLRQLPREGMRVKRGVHHLPHAPSLRFPVRAACMGYVVLPVDPGEPHLPGSLPPWRGDGRLLQILLYACPPEVHQRG